MNNDGLRQTPAGSRLPDIPEAIAAGGIARYVLPDRPVQTAWTATLEPRFQSLVALPVGWDGYNGRPVSFAVARFAADLLQRLDDAALPPPALVPGSDGSLQIEWHLNHYDIEVDILGACDVVATRQDCLTGAVEELSLDTDFTRLAAWLADLKGDRLMAAGKA